MRRGYSLQTNPMDIILCTPHTFSCTVKSTRFIDLFIYKESVNTETLAICGKQVAAVIFRVLKNLLPPHLKVVTSRYFRRMVIVVIVVVVEKKIKKQQETRRFPARLQIERNIPFSFMVFPANKLSCHQ